MDDSAIYAELERVRSAYDTPMLSLLKSITSDFQIAAMRAVFEGRQAALPYDIVASRLDEVIALVPEDERPKKDARGVIASWLRDDLLRSDTGDDGVRIVALTSAALRTLQLIDDQTSTRPLLGGSRVTAITEAIADLAARTSGNTDARKAQLRERIAALTSELQKLEAGEGLEDLTTDDVIDQTSHLLDMASTLPEQFTKVAEVIRASHRQVAAQLRAGTLTQGQIARDYLSTHDGLEATAEGRAYTSATQILRSDDRLARLSDDVSTILEHPATDALMAWERTRLERLGSDLKTGIDVVRTEHRRVTNTFSRYLRSADPAADRAVARLLQKTQMGLQQWMTTSRPRDTIDVLLGNEGSLDLGRLPASWPDPADYAPPASPAEAGEGGTSLSLAELQALGGPRTQAILEVMPGLARQYGCRTLGEVFAHLPEDLMRPVELIGLIAEARALGAHIGTEASETIVTRRPDESTRTLAVPLIHLAAGGGFALPTEEQAAS